MNAKRRQLSESAFQKGLSLSSILLVLMLGGIFITLLYKSRMSLMEFGPKFLYDTSWDPVLHKYGALPFLVGTLLTSLLAIIISTPFSLSISIFLGEYYKSGVVSSFLRSVIELLAGIPSVIYGFWALFYLVPLVRKFEMQAGILPYGVGIFTASLVLSIMIIPYSASISRDVISLVPGGLKEAAYSVGATRFEVIRKVVLPYARSGIFAGIILALGRALGETMAVTMVIGNTNILPDGLFSPGNTMASVIANEFTEATEEIYLSSLIEIGLILFVVSFAINMVGKEIIKRVGRTAK